MEKKEARRLIQEAIRRMTSLERASKSAAICERLLALRELQEAQTVMGFLSMPDELDTAPILSELLAAGKRVYVPRTDVKQRLMFPVRLNDMKHLRMGEYGIREPNSDEQCDPSELDFVLVPGRAFDRAGNRLGRGAAFYDRFMCQRGFRAVRCGIAFACQVLDAVPHDAKDVPVQILVTEFETLRIA